MTIIRKCFRSVCTFIAIIAATAVFFSSSTPILAQTIGKAGTASPYSIINNFGKDPKTGRNFTWVTSAAVKTGFVEYCSRSTFGGFGKQNVIRVNAQSQTVKTDSDVRTIHKAAVNGLKPGTEYVYRVGSAEGYSVQGTFRTAEADAGSFTFLNITDTQGESTGDYAVWKNTLDKALARFPDARFLVHTGDMVDVGYLINQWDMFTGAVKDEMMNLPILPVVGNHEALNGNHTNDNEKNFTQRFNLPDARDTGAPAGTVYSVDYGSVHIAVMNTQCGSSNFKKQADWLRKDMTASTKPWKVVALHRGPYGATYDTVDIRKAWAPVFDELGVDLVLQGHDHNYVRSLPMKNGSVAKDGKGTVYLVGDTGGVKYYPLANRSWQAVDLQPKTPMYVAVTVAPSKMTVNAYDTKGVQRDSFTLTK